MPLDLDGNTASWKKAAKRRKQPPKVAQSTIDALMNLNLDTPAPPPAKKASKKAPKPTGEALLSAASGGDSALACQLIEAGADVNAKQGNGWTALQHAADHEDLKLATLLLDRGAEINHRNIPTGRAAIHYAAMADDSALLRLLIDRGAELDIRSNDGETPLFDAASSGKEICVMLLVDGGCDVTAKNLAGKGVVYAAAAASKGDIAELLTTYPAQSAARREALEEQKKVASEALAGAQTVLQEKVTVGRPLVFKAPAGAP